MSHNPAFILFHPEVKAGPAVIRPSTLPVLEIQLKFTLSVNESSGCTERGGPSVSGVLENHLWSRKNGK